MSTMCKIGYLLLILFISASPAFSQSQSSSSLHKHQELSAHELADYLYQHGNSAEFQLALSYYEQLANSENSGKYSLLVACEYFIPDPEGELDLDFYYRNKKELSKLNTGRHGCLPSRNGLRNYTKALHYFSRVVDYSLPNHNPSEIEAYRATQAIGVIYRDGLGVPVDKNAAAFFFMATREAE